MAVQRLRFYGDGDGTTGTLFIDLSKALSATNRKLHRQKQIYTVYGGYYVDSNGSRIDINVAPNTWVTKRAINRGFKMWRKSISETLKNTDGMQTGKYSDFKLYLNNGMGSSTLMPVDAADVTIPTGEWDYSTLVSENEGNVDSFDLHIVGPHSGSTGSMSRVGLMKSWLDSRPLPTSQNQPHITSVAKDDPLSNLNDNSGVVDDRIAQAADEGDQRPYDEDTFWGYYSDSVSGGENNLQRVSSAVTVANSIAITPIHGFEALCGLVQINVSADTSWELVLDVETEGVSF